MSELEIDYFDNTEFCDSILKEANLCLAEIVTVGLTNSKDKHILYETYRSTAETYINNLGYKFKVSLPYYTPRGVDLDVAMVSINAGTPRTWTTLVVEGKASDLTHFKLRYL